MLASSSKMQVPSATAMQRPRLLSPAAVSGVVQQSRLVARAGGEQGASMNVCKTCGVDLSKAPSGCDGEGRIIGGLAAIPGFGWWPIKAYKPCGGLSAAGMDYVRKGQPTNEMLFGGVSLGQGQQQESLDVMTKTAERGIEVDIKQ